MILAQRAARLDSLLAARPGLLVALSGGVDSAVLLAAAARALPGRVAAATTRSPAVPEGEIRLAVTLANRLGVPHVVVDTRELDDASYRANTGDRCYFCRREMYGRLRAAARARGLRWIADGLNADDDPGDRPGVRAAREHEVVHPLREAGLTKAQVRRLAAAYGLPEVAGKPAQPCLASRLPAGVKVTVERLARVERAECALRDLGFRVVRVRCEDGHGRIEIGPGELERARERRAELEARVRAAGFATAAVDPRGYRWKSGR